MARIRAAVVVISMLVKPSSKKLSRTRLKKNMASPIRTCIPEAPAGGVDPDGGEAGEAGGYPDLTSTSNPIDDGQE